MSAARMLLAVFALMAFGFWSGWTVRGDHAAKQEVRQLQADRRETASNIVEAVETSVRVDSAIEADHARIEPIRKEVAVRLSHPTYAPRHDPDLHLRPNPATSADVDLHDPVPAGPAVLDAGTVRLLNAARAGAELRATAGRNGQEPAAAGPGR